MRSVADVTPGGSGHGSRSGPRALPAVVSHQLQGPRNVPASAL